MKEYKKYLDAIGSANHNAIMAYHELRKEYEKMEAKVAKYENQAKTEYKDGILGGISNLIGRTIKSIEYIRDYCSSCGYLCVVCEDGQRVIILGNPSEQIRIPEVEINKMKEMIFFNDDEVQKAIDEKERKRRNAQEEIRREKERELERLKKELGKGEPQ